MRKLLCRVKTALLASVQTLVVCVLVRRPVLLVLDLDSVEIIGPLFCQLRRSVLGTLSFAANVV